MSAAGSSREDLQARGRRFAQSKQLGWLGRAGLVARGFVYAIVGVLALGLALGIGGATTSQQGAMRKVAQEPFGKVLLIAVAIGLAGYSIWRLTRAAVGHGQVAEDSTLERLGGAASGAIYAGLCATAVSIIIGAGSSSGGASQTTGGVLGWTGGTWIVGIIGAIVIGVGLQQVYRGISADFMKKSKTDQMNDSTKRSFSALGTFGHVARGVVFAIIGAFLIKAAVEFDPKAAITIDGALSKLANASYGPLLLGVVAAGLLGFGIYSIADAHYRIV